MTIRGLLLATTLLTSTSIAWALDGEIAGISYNLKTTVVAGVAVRTEDRNLNQVAKLSVPGQGNLCNNENNGCTTVQGNLDLIHAKGSFAGVNADDGNWNYNKGDITDSLVQATPELKLQRGDLKVVVSGLFFYDPVNANFTEYHGDNTSNSRFAVQGPYSKRAQNVVDIFARGAELRKAFFQYTPEVFGLPVNLKVGRQVLPWGESLLVLFNNLNQLNPLDANAAARPGFQLSDLSTPVNMAVLSFPVVQNLSLELVAPLEWRPVRAPPHGSFASTVDPVNNDFLTLGLGNQHENPDGVPTNYGNNNLLIKTSYSPRVLPPEFGRPSNKGQFGGRLTYIADWLNNGTEISLHYLRYHSQFPYLSGYAAKESCWHRSQAPAGTPEASKSSAAFLQAAKDCNGFANGPSGTNPLTVDTLKVFLDYPEDIDMYGLSFNSNVFGVAFSGEYAFRPNMPLQILTTDVAYALLQPALPTTDLQAAPSSPGGPAIIIPSGRNGIPDYLSQYRGFEIQGGQLIRGYERFPVHNVSMSLLKLFPHNILGAEDMTTILEVGATYVDKMTGDQVLPLNASGDNTHTSPGADGTGNGGVIDTRRLTPTQQTFNRPTALSYGYRAVMKLAYNTLIPGAILEPSIIFFHDLKGITPGPQTNYIEGRKIVNLGLVVRFPNQLQLGAGYEAKFGSNIREYQESDRDRALFYGSYSF